MAKKKGANLLPNLIEVTGAASFFSLLKSRSLRSPRSFERTGDISTVRRTEELEVILHPR